MIQIKTVADFKRAVQLGTKLHCIYHKCFAGRDEHGQPIYRDQNLGIREISIRQSNSFALKTIRTDGKEASSWCDFPKASQSIVSDNKVIIMEQGRDGSLSPVLTYTVVS